MKARNRITFIWIGLELFMLYRLRNRENCLIFDYPTNNIGNGTPPLPIITIKMYKTTK